MLMVTGDDANCLGHFYSLDKEFSDALAMYGCIPHVKQENIARSGHRLHMLLQ